MGRSFWSRWCWPILCGQTLAVALPIALVVGSVLLAVNQGSQIVSGRVGWSTIVRGVANYAIPYVVSSIGFLRAPQMRHGSGSP